MGRGHRLTKITSNVIIRQSTYDFLFDLYRKYASILYRFRVIASYLLKDANFNLLHLHLTPPLGVIPFEFRRDLWRQKTKVRGLSYGIACVILCLAVLIQQRHVTTDERTHNDG